MLYNVYCDESCHLENDNHKSMVIGGLYCPIDKVKIINGRISEIKRRYELPFYREFKWTKISKAKDGFYFELVDYFINNEDLKFRAIKIPDKSKLKHWDFNQTHDDWYYKMYYDMLKHILNYYNYYNIYIDIKDTRGGVKIEKLKKILEYKIKNNCINKIQQIRSYESNILQLSDLLIGSIGYEDRITDFGSNNSTKLEICKRLRNELNVDFASNTSYNAQKFNLLVWECK